MTTQIFCLTAQRSRRVSLSVLLELLSFKNRHRFCNHMNFNDFLSLALRSCSVVSLVIRQNHRILKS
jgi:hypothetical protein